MTVLTAGNTKIGGVEKAYRASSLLLSVATVALGLAILTSTLARGGGPLALGVLIGLSLTVVGAARLWLSRRGAPRPPE